MENKTKKLLKKSLMSTAAIILVGGQFLAFAPQVANAESVSKEDISIEPYDTDTIHNFTPTQTKNSAGNYVISYTWSATVADARHTMTAVYNLEDGTTQEEVIFNGGQAYDISGTVNFVARGAVKSVTLVAKNREGISHAERTADVSDKTGSMPVINASDIELNVGDKFDPMANVTATDKEDGDLTNKIKITANNVDTSKTGTYHVTYSVQDSDNNITTKTITVKVVEKTVGEIKSAVYVVGNSAITGTYSGDVTQFQVTVNGAKLYTGGTTTNGTFNYNVDANLIGPNDVVTITAFDKNGRVLDENKPVKIISGTFSPDEYVIGESKGITGTYTGDVHHFELYVNDFKVSDGGSAVGGTFNYYVQNGRIKEGDNVYLIAYDVNGNKLATEPVKVSVYKSSGTITPDTYVLGSGKYITGTFTGDVSYAKVTVNGVELSPGGDFPTNGNEFTYYVDSLIRNTDADVTITAYDKNNNQLDSKKVHVVAPDFSGDIYPDEYILGEAYITGIFEGDVSYAKVYVDGRELKPGGNFDVNTHEFTYYVGANTVTNINQTVTIVAYDQYYNELNRHDVFLAEHN